MVKIRELQLDDYAAVRALNERNGLRTPAEAEWSRLWVHNPHADQFGDVPMGWAMEDANRRIVGAACNVPVMYDFGGRSIRSSTGMAWAVDPDHRSASLLLLDAFFSQSTVDLLLNTTANPVAGKAWEAFQAERLPHDTYDRNLLWVTRYQRFAKAATRRLTWRGARMLQISVAAGLAIQDSWRRLRSARTKETASERRVVRLDGFDDRFDTLWDALRSQGDVRLRAIRDVRSLNWHFGPALVRDELIVLGCLDDTGAALNGYLIARRNDRTDIKLRRYQIADLQVRTGRESIVPHLVGEALRIARTEKAAAVELTGFEPAKHLQAAAIPHRIRRLETWPFFFKSRDPELQAELRSPDSWDPSPFDGDATL